MKKLILLFTIGVMTSEANAQLSSLSALTLTGSSYTENFDGLASGLPTGWHVFTEATDISLGRYWDTSATKWLKTPSATGSTRTNWNGTTGNFRNVASADAGTSTLDSISQLNATDRALGIRQISPTSTTFPKADSGGAFTLKLMNTVHRGGFELTFKLQSLDETSPRVSTWAVDYGFGDVPASFTTVAATGTMTTGGNTFSNNTITVDFGTALDSVATPVWIRIAALDVTTGSGNRTTTAIDDVELAFTPNAAASVANVNNQALSFFIAGTATANNIMLGGLENGKYSIAIVDMVGRTVYSSNTNVSGQQTTITDANLQSGLYMMKVSNGQRTGVVKVNVQ